MWISPLHRCADSARGRSPIRRGGTKFFQCEWNASTPSPFQNSSALPADRHSYKAQMHRRKATESLCPAPRFYRFLPLCLFVHWKGSFRGDLNFAKSNIEFTCRPAQSRALTVLIELLRRFQTALWRTSATICYATRIQGASATRWKRNERVAILEVRRFPLRKERT